MPRGTIALRFYPSSAVRGCLVTGICFLMEKEAPCMAGISALLSSVVSQWCQGTQKEALVVPRKVDE